MSSSYFQKMTIRKFFKKYKTHKKTYTQMVKKSTGLVGEEEIAKKIAEMEAAHRRFYSIRALKTIDGLFSTPASERTYFDYCRFSYLNFDGHRNKDGSIDKHTMEAKRFYDIGIGKISKAVKNHTEAVENAKSVLKRLKRKPYRKFRLRKPIFQSVFKRFPLKYDEDIRVSNM